MITDLKMLVLPEGEQMERIDWWPVFQPTLFRPQTCCCIPERNGLYYRSSWSASFDAEMAELLAFTTEYLLLWRLFVTSRPTEIKHIYVSCHLFTYSDIFLYCFCLFHVVMSDGLAIWHDNRWASHLTWNMPNFLLWMILKLNPSGWSCNFYPWVFVLQKVIPHKQTTN